MALLEAQAVRIALAIVAIAAVFAGMTFAGVAVFLALMTNMHAAWAAAIVAAVMIMPVVIGAIIVRVRALPVRPAVAAAAAPAPAVGTADEATVRMIAGLAQEKPLLAVLFAGLLGAAGTVLQQKSRVN
jgi:hypothetical protein